MSTARLSQCLADPRLQAFLPMLYVAWADGDLSDEEIAATRARIEALEELDDACRTALAQWLEPSDPPTPEEMSALLTLDTPGGARPRDAREADAGAARSRSWRGAPTPTTERETTSAGRSRS